MTVIESGDTDAALSVEHVVLAVPPVTSALQRPAPEGARIVALHWLTEMYEARELWNAAIEDAHHTADREAAAQNAASALHRTRVALRRLRATLREHRSTLALRVDRKCQRALRRIGQATNIVRDRDVQREWLDAERESLPESARAEADVLRAWLQKNAGDGQTLVTRVLERQFDPYVDRIAESLRTYTVTRRLGMPADDLRFADHLATRVERSGQTLVQELDAIDGVEDQELLHELRIRLKRQRAMLAPFSRLHPDVGAWYAMATRGQDLLGAMRDAMILADLAEQHGHQSLPPALRSIALGHFEAFRVQWCDAPDVVRVAITNAAAALHTLAHDTSRDATTAMPAPDGDTPRATVPPPRAHPLPMEIERKFLLHGLPPHAAMSPSLRIDQGWLPGTVLKERLRRTTLPDGTEQCLRTIKFGPMGARVELEEPTDPALFAALWPLTVEARIRKRRHIVAAGDLTWEIDVFLDRDLVIAEVELQSETQDVAMPEWLAPFIVREVTYDPTYLNSEMARRDVSVPEMAIR